MVICHFEGGGKEPLTELLRGFKKGKIELNDLSLLEQQAYQTQTSHKFNELDLIAYLFIYKTDKCRSTPYLLLTRKSAPVSKFRPLHPIGRWGVPGRA